LKDSFFSRCSRCNVLLAFAFDLALDASGLSGEETAGMWSSSYVRF
jgi:hypothetical protein